MEEYDITCKIPNMSFVTFRVQLSKNENFILKSLKSKNYEIKKVEKVEKNDEKNEEKNEEIECLGCKNDIHNQLGHMEKNGCLYYSESTSSNE